MTENVVPILLFTLMIVLIVILFIVVFFIFTRLKSLEQRQARVLRPRFNKRKGAVPVGLCVVRQYGMP